MIDSEGFRANVGIIVTNAQGKLLWARRSGSQNAWQFPQGGVNDNETPVEAMYRELKEELGLDAQDVKILAESKEWLRYRLPERFQRHDDLQKCIGQKQKWFLLRLINQDAEINLTITPSPEFDSWAWVSYWYPLYQVVAFKRRVYQIALKEFAPIVLSKRF